MTKRILQLGYGKQGKLVLEDLVRTGEFDELVVADAAPHFLREIRAVDDPRVKPVSFDVDDYHGMVEMMKKADVVVELLPIRFTMQVAQAAVEAGTHLVSSVFIRDWSVQDPEGVRRQQREMEEIDRIAGEKGLTVLKEFGMDPGLDVVVAGEAVKQLDEVKVLYNYGAGFPEHRLSNANPLGYKFTWSIVDTVCSYSIPGRLLKNGEYTEVAADEMFLPENTHTLDLQEMGGPLECFVNGYGDSLAELFPSIADTATSLGRFICRWPGHRALWEKLIKMGFAGTEPIDVDGARVAPAYFCAELLGSQEQFHYGPGERDAALIRSDVRGYRNGEPTRVVMQLIDFRDLETGYTAMQRTVAFPMSIATQMILQGDFSKPGIAEPSDVPFEPFLKELRKRGLDVSRKEERWDGSQEPGGRE
ncbi:MAG: saccharopine dehydrogenase NADP-binding domain-containing protein [Synergistales bacterium]|nr:saccharopine dehydrogenase NADP-binding domain-containing protein [Synergistales bacterium]